MRQKPAHAAKGSKCATDELVALVHAGREFILSLSDSDLTHHPETGKEHKDVAEFREALDRAAKAVRS